MKNLILYFLIWSIANIGFVSGIIVIFYEKIEIEYHIDLKVLIIVFLIFSISIITISKLLSMVFNKSTVQYTIRIMISTLLGSLTLNVITLIRSFIGIINYQDEIFKCKFFTLKYIYSRQEIEYFIERYYIKLSTLSKNLTIKDKNMLLNKSKTIREARENVEIFCDYEANAWLPKINNFINNLVNNILSYSVENPIVIVGVITAIGVTVCYPLYLWIKNIYNIQKVAVSVSEVNGSVTAINETTQSLIEAAKNMQVQISYQSKLQQVTVKVLSDFLCQEIAIFNTEQLTDKERTNIMASLSYMNDRLLQALDISKYNEINAYREPVNTTGFIGTGNILGGTSTSSRLVEKTTD